MKIGAILTRHPLDKCQEGGIMGSMEDNIEQIFVWMRHPILVQGHWLHAKLSGDYIVLPDVTSFRRIQVNSCNALSIKYRDNCEIIVFINEEIYNDIIERLKKRKSSENFIFVESVLSAQEQAAIEDACGHLRYLPDQN